MRRNRWLRAVAVLVAVGCLPLLGCETKRELRTETSFAWFDTVTSLSSYGADEEQFEAVWERVSRELGDYHRLYDIYHAYEGLNNLYTVNETVGGVHREVEVDPRIMDLLSFGLDAYERTDGRVNIAMGGLLRLWHDHRQAGREDPASATLPSEEQLRRAAEHMDIGCMILDREAGTVFLSDPQTTLDVGAIAKGYAAQQVAETLEAEGIEGYLLSVGGNVCAIGSKGEGEPFSVGIEDPLDPERGNHLAVLELADRSLVTSGSYQRYYTVDGVDYHHIIDPDTGMPARGYRSVSVVCASSGEADLLSTALFTLSYEEGLAILSRFPGAEALWVLEDGTQRSTAGFWEYVKK